jgi:SAM-dependent methyltransferase
MLTLGTHKHRAGKAVSVADVSDYYSTVLTKSADLKTSCCTTAGTPPLYLRQALSNIHDDVMAKYYGCGFIAPDLLEGLHVLDLGCGAGRDCYVLSQLVGEHGRVVGVDMSEAQLATARGTQDWHRLRFGHQRSNVEFIQAHLETMLDQAASSATGEGSSATSGAAGLRNAGSAAVYAQHAAASTGEERDGTASLAIKDEPEDSDSDSDQEELTGVFRSDDAAESGAEKGLQAATARQQATSSGLRRESFHVIVSNCVLNLSPDKAAVLNNAYELLKPGKFVYLWFSSLFVSVEGSAFGRDVER